MGGVSNALERIWQALPDPVLVIGLDGTLHRANDAAEAFLGTSSRQLMRKSFFEGTGKDSRLADLVLRMAQAGAPLSEYNVEFHWPDAPVRRVDLNAVLLGDDLVLMTLHPRPNADRLGRQMGSRDAARSVVGMASMLAHEIKNPLAGISGAAQLLQMSASVEDRELADLIEEEAERITKLVERVEAFGEMGLGRRKPVNIHDVLDRAAKAAKAGFAAHVRFVESYDPSLPPTFGDPDQLMQVMQNLLKNAAEAAPPIGGVLMLKTSYRAGLKVRSGSASANLPLQIEISDNGQGVPEELLPDMFEPFVTSKSTGSGLGLALVSKIVADHGGVISCDSKPGFTTFRMLLPVARAADVAQAAEDAA